MKMLFPPESQKEARAVEARENGRREKEENLV